MSIDCKQIEDFIKKIPYFKGVSSTALSWLAKHLEVVSIEGGTLFIQEGAQADAVYLVMQGRLAVESEHNQIYTELGPTEIVGEMALITNLARNASVTTIRDSVLLKLSKAHFNDFIKTHTEQALSLIQHSMRRVYDKPKKNITFKTVAIAPAGNSQVYLSLSTQLKNHLAKSHKVLWLDQQVLEKQFPHGLQDETLNSWLAEQEEHFDLIFYVTDESYSSWTQKCFRQADRILLIANGQQDPQLNDIETHLFNHTLTTKRPIELVLCQPKDLILPCNTHGWLTPRTLTHFHHHKLHSTPSIEKLIRYLNNESNALVLAGGGARGFGHIGVIKAFKELNIPIDFIGGTSMGSVIAAFVALDLDIETIKERCHVFIDNYNISKEYTVPSTALTTTKSWQSCLKAVYGESTCIEDLWHRFFCISTNLTKSQQQIHDKGCLWKSIRASIALPAIAPPINDESGDLLVDGGLINNMPTDVMVEKNNCKNIFSVEVFSEENMRCLSLTTGVVPGPIDLLKQTLTPWRRKKNQDSPKPNIAEVIMQSMTVPSQIKQRENRKLANLNIILNLPDFGLVEFKKMEEIIAAGYENAWPQLTKFLEAGDNPTD